MKINILELPEEGLALDVKELLEIAGYKLDREVAATLRISKVAERLELRGRLDTGVILQCSRCLKEFSVDVEADFSVEYHPISMLRTEEEHELRKDEIDIDFYTEDTFDIDELLKEQVILNIPMKPLCNPNCKGICPHCGRDLNKGLCGCETKEIDPRLLALKKLLKN